MLVSCSRVLAFLVLSTPLLLVGCGDEESPVAGGCRTSDDCPNEQACAEARCVASDCAGDEDCADGLFCDDGLCAAESADATTDVDDADAGTDTTDTFSDADDATDGSTLPPDVVDGEVDATDAGTDAEPDVDYGPLTFTVDPPDGTRDVPLGSVVTVTFNQPIAELTLIPSNLDLDPLSGESPYPFVTYNPETFELTVTPCEGPGSSETCENQQPLQPNTPYEFTLTQFIRARTGETLGRNFVSRFSTGQAVGAEFHAALAEAYAPVVYQEVEENRYDTFTSIDFDGNQDVTDNLASARSANPGSLYYSVVESTTHYFITYMLYYPGRRLNDDAVAEHDFTNVEIIVRKQASDPLGRIDAFVTFYNGAYSRWAMENSWYTAEGSLIAGDLAGRLPASVLEDERRISILVEAGSHDTCLSTIGDGRCAPAGGANAPFATGAVGLVYRPGATAQRIGDAANDNLTYTLRSFDRDFWVFRDQVTGANARFGGTVLYTAPETAPGIVRPGDGARFPSSLNSSSGADSFGDLPFSLGRSVAFPADAGIWFVDPAYYFDEQFDVPNALGLNYCFNTYLDLDNRDNTEGCTRSTFTLP
jgi:hypothetical protein